MELGRDARRGRHRRAAAPPGRSRCRTSTSRCVERGEHRPDEGLRDGQHIKGATLTGRKAGKDQQEYLTFKFHDVLSARSRRPAASMPISRRPTRCRSSSPRSRSTTGHNSGTGHLRLRSTSAGTSSRTRTSRSKAPSVEPVRAVSPPTRPEPPHAESADATAELARPCGSPDMTRLGFRNDSRPATSSSHAHRSCRRISAGSGTPTRSPCCSGSSARRPSRTRARRGAPRSAPSRASRGSVPARRGRRGRSRRHPHRPPRRMLITSDHAAVAEGQADHVPGVHHPWVALAHLTPRGSSEARSTLHGNGSRRSCSPPTPSTSSRQTSTAGTRYAEFDAALNGQRRRTRPRQLLGSGREEAFRPHRSRTFAVGSSRRRARPCSAARHQRR